MRPRSGLPLLLPAPVAHAAVEGGGVLSLPVRARAHRDDAYGVMHIRFSIADSEDAGVSLTEDSRFLGPTP